MREIAAGRARPCATESCTVPVGCTIIEGQGDGVLAFTSSSSGIVDSRRAMAACLVKSLGEHPDCDLIISYATLGQL